MTRNKRERELNRMNRRRVLQAAGAFGLGAASLTFMDQAAVAEAMTGDEVSYVAYIKSVEGERQPVYKTMPRDRWNRIKSAVRVRDRLDAQLQQRYDDPALTPIFQAMDDSPTGHGVVVAYETTITPDGEVVREPTPSLEQVERRVPSQTSATIGDGKHETTVSGIPVEVRPATVTQTKNCYGETGGCQDRSSANYSDLPGGLPCGFSNGAEGSFAPRFTHPTYGDGWVTAGHVPGGTGYDALYPSASAGVVFGTVTDYYENGWDEDYAFIQEGSYGDALAELADGTNSGGIKWDITGIVTDTEIESDASDGTNYYTMGAGTCEVLDQVIGMSSTGIKTDHDNEVGDSGGAIYKAVSSDCAYMAGMMTAESNWGTFEGDTAEDDDGCADDCGGPTAEYLEAAMNGAWATKYSC